MFQIDTMSRTPVYEQIISQVEKLIIIGALNSGDKLPSVRSMSMELSVNPNTIQKVYNELDTIGLIRSVPGRGCFIGEDARLKLRSVSRDKLEDIEKLAWELFLAGVSTDEITGAVVRGVERAKGGCDR